MGSPLSLTSLLESPEGTITNFKTAVTHNSFSSSVQHKGGPSSDKNEPHCTRQPLHPPFHSQRLQLHGSYKGKCYCKFRTQLTRMWLEDGRLQLFFEHAFKVQVSGHELFFHIIERPLVICQF